MSIYDSGWIVNFKDGERIIFSENAYKFHRKIMNTSEIESLEHWFSLDDAIRKNPGLEFIK